MADGTPIIIIKKKKSGGHGHHGGAWKVAYADFVTAMMAFFMTLWIIGMASENDKKLIAGYFKDPIGFEKNMPKGAVNLMNFDGRPYAKPGTDPKGLDSDVKAETRKAVRMKAEIEEELAAGKGKGDAEVQGLFKNLAVNVTDEGLEIEFVENTGVVFFETGSAVIRPAARRLIGLVAPILSQSHRPMIIDGHTDRQPFPSESYDNWDLSNDRAQSIRRALKVGGVGDGQILAVRGFAATRLKRPDDPYHFSNRRVTVLLPFDRTGESALDLPKDVVDRSVEGAFRSDVPAVVPPTKPPPVDLKRNHAETMKPGFQ